MGAARGRKAQRKKNDATIGLRGFFRVQIVDGVAGRSDVKGDSGWQRNVVTSQGIRWMMSLLTLTVNSTEQIRTVALGTGGSVSYSNTELPGCVDPIDYSKLTVSISSSTGAASGNWSTLQFRATFASGWNSTDGATGSNINNVGLYDSDGGPGGVFFAGNSYPVSNCATNQAVNVTYNLLMGSQ